jgi:quinol monooxygenase YgiN
MPTIVVHARVETAPGAVDAMRNAIATMERASRAEPGCIEYVFTSSLEDPTTIRIFEHWQSMDDLRSHFATPHMRAFNTAMRANPPKSIAAKVYEVARELPLPTS